MWTAATKTSNKGISHIKDAECGIMKGSAHRKMINGVWHLQAMNNGYDKYLTIGFGHTYRPSERNNGDVYQYEWRFDFIIKPNGKYHKEIKKMFDVSANGGFLIRNKLDGRKYVKNVWIPENVADIVLRYSAELYDRRFNAQKWKLKQHQWDAIASYRHMNGSLGGSLFELLEKSKHKKNNTVAWRRQVASHLRTDRGDRQLFLKKKYRKW